MEFQVDTCARPDASSRLVVRVIDESVLGVDVHTAVALLPSTEAESRQTPRMEVSRNRVVLEEKKYTPEAVVTPVSVPENVQPEPPEVEPMPASSSKPRSKPAHQKCGPSPTAVQAKLDFAPKKRPRITEVEVIELLDDDDDNGGAEVALHATVGACTAGAGKRPLGRSRPHPTGIRGATKRVTSTSDVADFNSSYSTFMEGFEIFLS